MSKLYELLNKKNKSGDIGLEIECEGKEFKEVNSEYWTSHDDGSLRGKFPDSRIEYVIKGPIPITNVCKAMEELTNKTKNAVPNFSFRTSVHVHVNVLELTNEQIQSFIYTYLLLEEALFFYCGKERKCNRFCLRLQDCDGLIEIISSLFKNGIQEIENYLEDQLRYASINLAAVKKYGSIEFRGMRGTLDSKIIDVWCNSLVSIRNYAMHKTNVLQVYEDFTSMGPKKFLEYVLGSLSSFYIYPKMEKDMLQSFSLSIELPYILRNKQEEPVIDSKPRKRKDVQFHLNDVVLNDFIVQPNELEPINLAPRVRYQQNNIV